MGLNESGHVEKSGVLIYRGLCSGFLGRLEWFKDSFWEARDPLGAGVENK